MLFDQGAGGAHVSGTCLTTDPFGASAQRRKVRSGLRTALLGTAALAGALIALPNLAQAQIDLSTDLGAECVLEADGITITCSGDVSEGIEFTDNGGYDYSNFVISNLSAPITPTSATRGISIFRGAGGDVMLDIDTGVFGITTNDGVGIYARSENGTGANGDVTLSVIHSGDITVTSGTHASGIYAFSRLNETRNHVYVKHDGDMSITSAGYNDGILAAARGYDSKVTIISSGDFVLHDPTGTGAPDSYGYGVGAITRAFGYNASGDRVYEAGGAYDAESTAGDIYIRHTGNLTVFGNRGMMGEAVFGGDVTLRMYGDVTKTGADDTATPILARVGFANAYYLGTEAGSFGNGDIDIKMIGDIVSHVSTPGMVARTRKAGSVKVHHEGDIFTAVSLPSNPASSESIGHDHGISADSGFGIYQQEHVDAYIDMGWTLDVDVVQIGNIVAGHPSVTTERRNDGIAARAWGGNVSVQQTGDITTYGQFSPGLYLETRWGTEENGTGNIYGKQDGSITTHGDSSHGIYAHVRNDGATVYDAAGVRTGFTGEILQSGDTTIIADSEITTIGAEAKGIFANTEGGGNIDITQVAGQITTSGQRAFGIQAEQFGGGNIDIFSEGGISTSGDDAHGVQAEQVRGGDLYLTLGGAINTTGDGAMGLLALNRSEGDIDINQTGSITTLLGGHGVYARTEADGDIRLLAGGIDAKGTGEFGLLQRNADDDPAGFLTQSVVANGVNLILGGDGQVDADLVGSVSGENVGVYVSTAVSETAAADLDYVVSMTVSDLISGGSGTAIDLTNVRLLAEDSSTANGANVQLILEPGYAFDGIVDARNFDGAEGSSLGDNRLVLGGELAVETFDLSQISADLIEDEGEVYFGFNTGFLKTGSSTFWFAGAQQVGAEFSEAVIAEGLTVLPAEVLLNMSEDGDPLTILSGGGLASIGSGGTVNGNVLLGAEGIIALSNTSPLGEVEGLGDADDAFNVLGDFEGEGGALYIDVQGDDLTSDLLQISGAATGFVSVYANALDTLPLLTGKGSTDGILVVDVDGSSEATFALANELTSGAFTYELVQADGEDWYLQTTDVAGTGLVYPYTPYSLRTVGRQLTGSFADRIGYAPGSSGAGIGLGASAEDAVEANKGIWMRVTHSGSEADGPLIARYGSITQSFDAAFDEDISTFQFGYQGFARTHTNSAVLGSVFFHLATGETEVDGDDAEPTGRLDTEAFGMGGSLSLIKENGLYVDGIATITQYDVSAEFPELADTSIDAYGWTLGGEIGSQFDLSPQFALIPQAQLLYQNIAINDTVDANLLPINTILTESLEARIGTAMILSQDFKSGRLLVTGEGNVIEEFAADPVTVIDGAQIDLEFEQSTYDLGLGLEYFQDASAASVWLNGGYRAPMEGSGIETWTLQAGLRVSF